MPIYEISCEDCGYTGEVIVLSTENSLSCPSCESTNTHKMMSATSSITGKAAQAFPGTGDTACCGQRPDQASCAGPGSCCGKTF